MLDAAGNVYIAGRYDGQTVFGPCILMASQAAPHADVFVAKLDATGNWQWATSGGRLGDDHPNSLAISNTGQLTVVGAFEGNTTLFGTSQLTNAQAGAGTYDLFVARMSDTGTWQAALSVGGAGND